MSTSLQGADHEEEGIIIHVYIVHTCYCTFCILYMYSTCIYCKVVQGLNFHYTMYMYIHVHVLTYTRHVQHVHACLLFALRY